LRRPHTVGSLFAHAFVRSGANRRFLFGSLSLRRLFVTHLHRRDAALHSSLASPSRSFRNAAAHSRGLPSLSRAFFSRFCGFTQNRNTHTHTTSYYLWFPHLEGDGTEAEGREGGEEEGENEEGRGRRRKERQRRRLKEDCYTPSTYTHRPVPTWPPSRWFCDIARAPHGFCDNTPFSPAVPPPAGLSRRHRLAAIAACRLVIAFPQSPLFYLASPASRYQRRFVCDGSVLVPPALWYA